MTSHCVRFFCGVAAMTAFVLAGCGDPPIKEPPTGTATGKVTFKGNPVAKGRVSYTNKQGGVGTAEIKDGSYEIKGLKPGTYNIVVLPPDNPVPQDVMDKYMKGEIKELPKTGASDIPDKYQSDAAGLTTTVKEGANPFDIKME